MKPGTLEVSDWRPSGWPPAGDSSGSDDSPHRFDACAAGVPVQLQLCARLGLELNAVHTSHLNAEIKARRSARVGFNSVPGVVALMGTWRTYFRGHFKHIP